ncbi:MAG: helix-turn-helix transcriptional regulator [Acidiferrobacterales bacterium]
MPDKTLDAKQLAELLHMKPHTATNYVLYCPERLPPHIRLPSGKVLFFEKDVEEWLREHRVQVLPPPEHPADFSRKGGSDCPGPGSTACRVYTL